MDCLPLDRPRCFKLQHGVEHAHPDPFALLVTGRPKFERALNGVFLGGGAVLIDEQLGGAIRVERVHTIACDGKGRSCKGKRLRFRLETGLPAAWTIAGGLGCRLCHVAALLRVPVIAVALAVIHLAATVDPHLAAPAARRNG